MPAIVIKANKFHVDSKTPCRLVFVIPLELPSLLDSSVPPPPYHPPNNIDRWALHDATMTALRPAVFGGLYTALGPDAAISEMVPPNNRDWIPKNDFVSRLVNDRSKFDPESGDWTDQYGNMGSGATAYLEYGNEIAIIEAYEIRVDQGITDNKINVPVVELKAMPVLHDGKVAFVARKYEDAEQERYNHNIWLHEW